MSSENAQERSIQVLLAKDAIRDALYRYCQAVDRSDLTRLRTVYHPDAHETHGQFDGPASEYCENVIRNLAGHEVCQHMLSNITIDVEDSLVSARSEAFFFALMREAGAEHEDYIAGRYLDHFSCRKGDWRISRRLVVLDWTRRAINDASTRSPYEAIFRMGTRSPDDALYTYLER